MTMNEEFIENHNYGKLLFIKSNEEGNLDNVNQEIILLREIMLETPEIIEFLSDKWVEPREKEKVLDELLKYFSSMVAQFIRTLYELGEMEKISMAIDDFKHYYYDNKGILFAKVITVIELSEKQKRTLENKLKEIFQYESIKLWNVIDATILGGIIISTKLKLIDNSVRKQLESSSDN